MSEVRFHGRVEARGRGGRVIPLPADLDPRALFGAVRAPVRVTIGDHAFRTTLMRYGATDYIGLNRAVREAAGVDEGDEADVLLARDDEPREVVLPAELVAMLDGDPALREFYDSLSFTHRHEYAEWVGEAKREETRARRAERAAELLRERVRHP